MPRNYYDFNLEGINTDLLVVAALLNRADSFLYSTMEQKTGDMIFFLSPVYKWLVDLFSNPFTPAFTFHLLDFVFCAGNGALVLAAVSLVTQFRKQFITCETMEDVTRVFNAIPLMPTQDAVLSSVEYVYEACLMGNPCGCVEPVTCRREIQLLRTELHHETQRANSSCEETPAIEEQNGLVSDLLKGETRTAPVSAQASVPASVSPCVSASSSTSVSAPVSAQASAQASAQGTPPLLLSMQMSMHMQQIRSSFKRVSGFGEAVGEESLQTRRHLRDSMDIIAAEHFPSFADFSESCEEEADVNPWRESMIDEEAVKDLRRSWAEKTPEGAAECSEEVKCEEGEKRGKEEMQSMKKRLQSDALLKRVFLLYDNIRNRRTFNITNGEVECVVGLGERSEG